MNIQLIHKLIFAWFRNHARILPWREKIQASSEQSGAGSTLRDDTVASYFSHRWRRDPYRVLLSEVMLQQTQVSHVIPRYEEFLRRWPTVRNLAAATLSDVLVMWKGMGYNRRARYLHEMAKAVVEQYGGRFPEEEKELAKLPGVGQYTARAVLAFAFGQDVGVVDTNTRRIFSRVVYGVEPAQLRVPQKAFFETVDQFVPKGNGDPWNQALMDFGSLVCAAKLPKCADCPLRTYCEANLQAKTENFESYAVKLIHDLTQSSAMRKKSKDKVPFRQTDRYFRGRIIDKLREGPIAVESLRQYMEKEHTLADRLRWGKIIEGLVLDRLIQIRGSTVTLA